MNTNIYNKSKVMKTSQNKSKEFITLLIAIYTNRIAIPFILIYKGEFEDL